MALPHLKKVAEDRREACFQIHPRDLEYPEDHVYEQPHLFSDVQLIDALHALTVVAGQHTHRESETRERLLQAEFVLVNSLERGPMRLPDGRSKPGYYGDRCYVLSQADLVIVLRGLTAGRNLQFRVDEVTRTPVRIGLTLAEAISFTELDALCHLFIGALHQALPRIDGPRQEI